MAKMPAKNLDMRLLAVFNEMLHTGSVSATADVLDMTQPAISMCLNRLRKYFGDPLFVRTSNGMAPTPQALFLSDSLCRSYQLLCDATRLHDPFDPLTSNRTFRIAMVDAGYLAVFPRLFNYQQLAAPHTRFEFTSITKETGSLMAAGDIDLTIAFMPQLGPGTYQQFLVAQDFVGAVRCDHPRVKLEMTLEDYAQELHLAVSTPGTGHSSLDTAIHNAGIARKIGWQAESYLAIPPIIPSSDYVVTLPRAMARFFAMRGVLKFFPLPFKTPKIVVMQYWHERYHRDPGLIWLRKALLELFSESATVEGDDYAQRQHQVE